MNPSLLTIFIAEVDAIETATKGLPPDVLVGIVVVLFSVVAWLSRQHLNSIKDSAKSIAHSVEQLKVSTLTLQNQMQLYVTMELHRADVAKMEKQIADLRMEIVTSNGRTANRLFRKLNSVDKALDRVATHVGVPINTDVRDDERE